MMDPLLALPTRLSDDPLGLFLAIGTGGLASWCILYFRLESDRWHVSTFRLNDS